MIKTLVDIGDTGLKLMGEIVSAEQVVHTSAPDQMLLLSFQF